MHVPEQIQSQKRKTGIIAPKRFVQRLKRDNELFRSYMHQVRHTNNPMNILRISLVSVLRHKAQYEPISMAHKV